MRPTLVPATVILTMLFVQACAVQDPHTFAIGLFSASVRDMSKARVVEKQGAYRPKRGTVRNSTGGTWCSFKSGDQFYWVFWNLEDPRDELGSRIVDAAIAAENGDALVFNTDNKGSVTVVLQDR